MSELDNCNFGDHPDHPGEPCPTPQPAEAVAALGPHTTALAEALVKVGCCGAYAFSVSTAAAILANLPAGWTLTRDHARVTSSLPTSEGYYLNHRGEAGGIDIGHYGLNEHCQHWPCPATRDHARCEALRKAVADDELDYVVTWMCDRTVSSKRREAFARWVEARAALTHTVAASEEEWTDEGDPGPFAEGITTSPATEAEHRGGEG